MSMSSIPSPSNPPGTRKRRPWWVYLLWLLGLGITLVVALGIAVSLYWNHLVRTYTATQSVPLPSVEGAAERYPELKERWDAYALLFLHPERSIPPFELTGDDLNVFASRFGPFGKFSYLEILDGRFRVRFSAPLDATRNADLQGRFLNGAASLRPKLDQGKITLSIESLEANGKPIPGWMLRRLQRTNWGDRLNERPEFDLAIRALERLDISEGKLVLHPRPPTANP